MAFFTFTQNNSGGSFDLTDDLAMQDIPARHRFDAIFARNELNRRDMIAALGDAA